MKPATRKTLLALLFVAALACLGFALNAIFVGSMELLCRNIFAYVHIDSTLLAQKKFKEGDRDGALELLAALRALPLPNMERGYCQGILRQHPPSVVPDGVAAGLAAILGNWGAMADSIFEGRAQELDALERMFKHGSPQDLELTPEKVRAIERALEQLRQEDEAGRAPR